MIPCPEKDEKKKLSSNATVGRKVDNNICQTIDVTMVESDFL